MVPRERVLRIGGRRFLLKVEDSDASADYVKYEELRNEIWGFPDDSLPGARNMMCENFLHEGSSLFLGVFAEDAGGVLAADRAHMVGFSYGFVGLRDKERGFASPDNLWFYSQYTAVKPGFEGAGLGLRIKEFQRDILLGTFGVGQVVCTFDPLTAVNAHRNVHRLGMEVLEYRTATYGEYGGRLNRRDVPTDRFFMSWDLRADPVRPDAAAEAGRVRAGQIVEVEERTVEGRTGRVTLETPAGLALDRTAESAFIRVPADFYRLLAETDVADPAVRRIPVDWRMATRRAFLELFGRGYRVVDFLNEGGGAAGGPGYLLVRRAS